MGFMSALKFGLNPMNFLNPKKAAESITNPKSFLQKSLGMEQKPQPGAQPQPGAGATGGAMGAPQGQMGGGMPQQIPQMGGGGGGMYPGMGNTGFAPNVGGFGGMGGKGGFMGGLAGMFGNQSRGVHNMMQPGPGIPAFSPRMPFGMGGMGGGMQSGSGYGSTGGMTGNPLQMQGGGQQLPGGQDYRSPMQGGGASDPRFQTMMGGGGGPFGPSQNFMRPQQNGPNPNAQGIYGGYQKDGVNMPGNQPGMSYLM